jgi:hypothetical protein
MESLLSRVRGILILTRILTLTPDEAWIFSFCGLLSHTQAKALTSLRFSKQK